MNRGHRNNFKREGIFPRRFLSSLPILFFLSVFFGCASQPYRTNPEFRTKANEVRTPGLVLPEVKIHGLLSRGLVEGGDEWSSTCLENVRQAVLKGFRDKNYRIRPLTVPGRMQKEIDEILALYRAVNRSIQLHTYGPQLFPAKERQFDYTLGPLDHVMEDLKVDSMIFVSGFDEITPTGSRAFLSVAIADPSGTILWYASRGGAHDLREFESTARMVKEILSPLQEAPK